LDPVLQELLVELVALGVVLVGAASPRVDLGVEECGDADDQQHE